MALQTVPVMWDPACPQSAWHAKIFEGIQKAASAAQCSVQQLASVQDASKLGEPVILMGVSHENLVNAVLELTSKGLEVILAGMDAESLASQISCVTHSRSSQTIQLLRYFHECGKRRIALVGFGRNSLNDLVKLDAARSFMAMHAKTLPPLGVYDWAERLDESFSAFLPVWHSYDAVICPNDYAAFALIRFLLRNGVRVPEDLYVAGFSDQQIGRYLVPSITSVAMNDATVGRHAFTIWQQLRRHSGENLVFKIIVPGEMKIRGSTAFQQVSGKTDHAILWNSSADKDLFYQDETVRRLMLIENCLDRHDALDIQLIHGILNGESYEKLADRLYISSGSLHYRLGKIYRELNCRTKAEFVALMSSCYDRFELPEDEVFRPC